MLVGGPRLVSGGGGRETLGRGRKDLRWLLRHRSAPGDCLGLLDGQVGPRLLPAFLAEALVLLVDGEDKFLDVVAGDLVLVKVARADAQVQGLVALLLLGSLLEARALAPQSELDHVLLLLEGSALAADLDHALHVAALGADEPACHLELFFVLDLDVEPAGVLDVLVLGRGLLLGLGELVIAGLTRREHVVISEL